MIPMVMIGDYAVPDPSNYTGKTITIVDGARNTKGVMIGGVIRDDVGKVECKWKYITARDWAELLSKFSIARGGSYTNMITFLCQDSNSWETRKMYVSDRSASVFKRNQDGSIAGWLDAQISFIEV